MGSCVMDELDSESARGRREGSMMMMVLVVLVSGAHTVAELTSTVVGCVA